MQWGITPSEMCGGKLNPGSIFIWVREGEKGESERQSRSWESENQQAAAREEMEMGMGWVGKRKCPCFLPALAIRHPFLEGKSVFLPLVLSPNVLNLEKKEQNPDKCILFSNYKCRIRFRPRTDVTASSRLLGVSVPGPGALPPPLAVPAVGADGANETNCWLATQGHLVA